MPKLSHEVLVQLVRHAPALISELLWPGESPASPIVVSAAKFVDLNFEHRADALFALGGVPERPTRPSSSRSRSNATRASAGPGRSTSPACARACAAR